MFLSAFCYKKEGKFWDFFILCFLVVFFSFSCVFYICGFNVTRTVCYIEGNIIEMFEPTVP